MAEPKRADAPARGNGAGPGQRRDRGGRRRPVVNLALQGGGSHGAFTWGVLDRLLEDGRLDFEGISGASAGAMNAAALAHGWIENGRDGARAALQRFWRSVGLGGNVFGVSLLAPWSDLIARTISPYQFNPVNLNPLRTILEQQLDFERLREASPFRLFVAATNVRTGHLRVFDNAELDVDVLLASACLPSVYQAVEIGGEHYWDGGYMADPPLFPFFYECETGDLLLVMVNPLKRETTPRLPGDIVDRVNEINFNAALVAEMRAIAFTQRLLDEDWLRPGYRDRLKVVRVHEVASEALLADLGVASKGNTAPLFLDDLFDRGRRAAQAWLDQDLDVVGRRSSVDVRQRFLGQR